VAVAAILGPTTISDPLINGVGLDALMPIFVGVPSGGEATITQVSTIAYVPPGEATLQNIGIWLIGGFGTDSVPLDNVLDQAFVWQV
jgi:hypothetical protein